jgi:hypothetical protein
MYRIKILNPDGSLKKLVSGVTSETPEQRLRDLQAEYPAPYRVVIMNPMRENPPI